MKNRIGDRFRLVVKFVSLFSFIFASKVLTLDKFFDSYMYMYVRVYFFLFLFFYRSRSSRTPRKSQEHDHSSAPSILLNTAARWCAPILQQEYKFKVWDAIYHEFTSRHRIPKTWSRALHPRENISRSLFFAQINSVPFFRIFSLTKIDGVIIF